MEHQKPMKGFIAKLRNRAKRLKSEAEVLLIAYRDERTPFLAKLLIWITVGYLLSPIDLIPDFIPVLGMLDDLIIVPALIALSIRMIPAQVIKEARRVATEREQYPKKRNWLFGVLIILIWLSVVFFVWRWLRPVSL
jgi:uncharacterized membrane protein YkvA (DUF1232 family)